MTEFMALLLLGVYPPAVTVHSDPWVIHPHYVLTKYAPWEMERGRVYFYRIWIEGSDPGRQYVMRWSTSDGSRWTQVTPVAHVPGQGYYCEVDPATVSCSWTQVDCNCNTLGLQHQFDLEIVADQSAPDVIRTTLDVLENIDGTVDTWQNGKIWNFRAVRIAKVPDQCDVIGGSLSCRHRTCRLTAADEVNCSDTYSFGSVPASCLAVGGVQCQLDSLSTSSTGSLSVAPLAPAKPVQPAKPRSRSRRLTPCGHSGCF